MTKEHVDLLTKELSARLPYGVKIKTDFFKTATLISIRKNISLNAGKELSVTYDISGKDEPFQMDERWGTPISEIKPYLIPLSSMTEEQKLDLTNLFNCTVVITEWEIVFPNYYDSNMDNWNKVFNWCYKNHFDCNGLIPLGLAVDASGKNIY